MPGAEEIRADVAQIVNEVVGASVDDVQLDKSFTDDLDVDSLSMVFLSMGRYCLGGLRVGMGGIRGG